MFVVLLFLILILDILYLILSYFPSFEFLNTFLLIFYQTICWAAPYWACICLALRPKKEPRVSKRDINGLMDGGAYTSEAESWSDTPPCAAEVRAGHGCCRLHSKGQGEVTSYRGN